MDGPVNVTQLDEKNDNNNSNNNDGKKWRTKEWIILLFVTVSLAPRLWIQAVFFSSPHWHERFHAGYLKVFHGFFKSSKFFSRFVVTFFPNFIHFSKARTHCWAPNSMTFVQDSNVVGAKEFTLFSHRPRMLPFVNLPFSLIVPIFNWSTICTDFLRYGIQPSREWNRSLLFCSIVLRTNRSSNPNISTRHFVIITNKPKIYPKTKLIDQAEMNRRFLR